MPESLGLLTESFTYDKLFAGNYPTVTKSVVVLLGQNILRGTVLGKVTASGKYVKSLAAAADGSQFPDAILAEDANASTEDLTRIAYVSGEFNTNALVLGTGHTVTSVDADLRDKNIYLKTAIAS